jgi:hypothetical protein
LRRIDTRWWVIFAVRLESVGESARLRLSRNCLIIATEFSQGVRHQRV